MLPPDPGMAAPSSLQIIPSEIVITSATSQPSIACGPPRVDKSRGMVMNGPMPIMFVMLSAVASSKPKRRNKCGVSAGFSGFNFSVHFVLDTSSETPLPFTCERPVAIHVS